MRAGVAAVSEVRAALIRSWRSVKTVDEPMRFCASFITVGGAPHHSPFLNSVGIEIPTLTSKRLEATWPRTASPCGVSRKSKLLIKRRLDNRRLLRGGIITCG